MADPEVQKFEYILRIRFLALKNETKYETLIKGIKLALEVWQKKLVAHSDSQLVVEQVNKNYQKNQVW